MTKDDIAEAVAKGVEAGLLGALQKLGLELSPPKTTPIRNAGDMRAYIQRNWDEIDARDRKLHELGVR